jgi:hypothetical protein
MHEALRRLAGLTLVPLHIGGRATFRPSKFFMGLSNSGLGPREDCDRPIELRIT